MKRLPVILFALFVSLDAFATPQIPDKIIYNGQEYALFTNPLESLFESQPELRPDRTSVNTALWRGYRATFEVTDQKLFLNDIHILDHEFINGFQIKDVWISIFEKIFPGRERVLVDWLTGLLIIPYGKPIEQGHPPYMSAYENYMVIEIDKGHVEEERRFTYEEFHMFKERQFEAFKLTDEYKKVKSELKSKNRSDDSADDFLKMFIIEYSSDFLTE